MACKESMVTAPVMVMLYDHVFAFDSWRAVWRRRARLYGWLMATWILLAMLIVSGGRTSAGFGAGASPWTYLLNQAVIVARYLRLIVWPHGLVLDYGVPRALALSDVFAPGLFIVALVVVVALVLVR
jgi:hypothetical protein